MSKLKVLILLPVTFCSCAPGPLHGGRAYSSGGAHWLQQGENASMPSRQAHSTVRTRTCTIPLTTAGHARGISLELSGLKAPPNAAPASGGAYTCTDTEQTADSTELGAAQKDTTRELSARLGSLKGISWLGAALFLFGLASMFWPPLRAIIGSLTTSIAFTAGGVALIVLPTMIAGHEPLILGMVAAVVLAWFLAHRHGELRAKSEMRKPKSERNPKSENRT